MRLALGMTQSVKPLQRQVGAVLGQRLVRGARLDDLGGPDRGGAAEHHQVDQRVGAQAVGAVDRDAGRLTDRHQPRHDLVGVAVGGRDDLAAIVRRDAAHVVVDGRQHRDRLLGDVDTGEDLGGLGDAGQALVQYLGSRWSRCRSMWSFSGPTPRPSRISMVMARLTTSREARSLAVGA